MKTMKILMEITKNLNIKPDNLIKKVSETLKNDELEELLEKREYTLFSSYDFKTKENKKFRIIIEIIEANGVYRGYHKRSKINCLFVEEV